MSFIKKLVRSKHRQSTKRTRRSLPVCVPALLDVLPCLTRDDLVRGQFCSRGLRKFVDDNASLLPVHCIVELRLVVHYTLCIARNRACSEAVPETEGDFKGSPDASSVRTSRWQ